MFVDEENFLRIIEKNIQVKNKNLLIKAYNFSKKAHQFQNRDSGEPYFIHPLEIAIEISKRKLSENCVIAGLLHDTVEDTEITLEEIEKSFGKEVAYLVDGLTKIENVKDKSRIEENAENFRKLILSTAKDIRVLVIKLIDVLHNMRTINGIKNIQRKERIVNKALMVYVPLAERIGMYKLKLEIEDLCFKALFPLERKNIINNIKKAKKHQKNIIDDILKKLELSLKFDNNINVRIKGREKKPYSIWKKMKKTSISFERLNDIFAFRIIVKNIEDCYRVFGLISSNYTVIPNTFKDYINKPKSNGYQSLHFVIIGPKNAKLEIQIRTEEMDRVAEYGVASHWMYKQNIAKEKNLPKYNLIKNLVQNLEKEDFDADRFEDLKFEMSTDEIFCYTPLGDIINLPAEATGIDFAYAIHDDIGNKCSGVKINGILSQFKTKLHSGDEVEVLTSKSVQINEEWLKFVKTAKAKNKIKTYINKKRQNEFEKIGCNDVKFLCKQVGVQLSDDLIKKKLTEFKQGKTIVEIYSLIAQGKISKKEIIQILFPESKKEKAKYFEITSKNLNKAKDLENSQKIGVEGLDRNIVYKYAKCCYPLPPEDIVGVVNSGVGITIHKKNCEKIKDIKDGRILDFAWDENIDNKYMAKIGIVFENKSGILAKIVNLCSEKKINIIGINTLNESEFYQEIDLKISVKNKDELENFKALIRGVCGVMEVL